MKQHSFEQIVPVRFQGEKPCNLLLLSTNAAYINSTIINLHKVQNSNK